MSVFYESLWYNQRKNSFISEQWFSSRKKFLHVTADADRRADGNDLSLANLGSIAFLRQANLTISVENT